MFIVQTYQKTLNYNNKLTIYNKKEAVSKASFLKLTVKSDS